MRVENLWAPRNRICIRNMLKIYKKPFAATLICYNEFVFIIKIMKSMERM